MPWHPSNDRPRTASRHERPGTVVARHLALDGERVTGFVQVGPAQRPVTHRGVQVAGEVVDPLEQPCLKASMDRLCSFHGGAVARRSQSVEIDAPAGITLVRAHDIPIRIEDIHDGAGDGRRILQGGLVGLLPEVGGQTRVSTAGRPAQLFQHPIPGILANASIRIASSTPSCLRPNRRCCSGSSAAGATVAGTAMWSAMRSIRVTGRTWAGWRGGSAVSFRKSCTWA